MSTTPTLAQINAAMAAVDAALQDTDITPELQTALDQLSNVLQGMYDATVAKTEQDLVDALAANNAELQALNTKVNELSAALDSASDTIQSVSNTVGTVASIIGALI